MAFPTVSAPYGFKPINRQDGLPYAGATTLYPITSVSTPIYNGDLVYIAAGAISKSTVTSTSAISVANQANVTAGVFMGAQYVNSMGQTVEGQYYPGNGAASTAYGYVVVDPNAAFKVAVTNGSGVVSNTTANAIGVNLVVDQTATGSTTTGDSAEGVTAPTSGAGNASTLPVKVIGVVTQTALNTTAFTEVVVVLTNPQMTSAAGSVNFS
jgi:hypothetical protein